MPRAALALSLLLLAAACQQGADQPGFSPGGGSSGDDTGSGGPTGDEPWIVDLSAGFEDYSGRWVLETVITYTDADGDLDGGNVLLDLLVDGKDWPMDPIPIDGVSAVLDGDQVIFALGGENYTSIDTSATYELTVRLEDAAGNRSNEASTTVDPM